MTMRVTMLFAAVLCFVCLDLISYASGGLILVRGASENSNSNSVSSSRPVSIDNPQNSNRLPSEIVPAEISDFLSPEMFSQPDPLIYFLEKSVKFSPVKAYTIGQTVGNLLYYRKLPSRYIPYGKLLKDLLKIQIDLDDVKDAIEIMRSSYNADFSPLPTGMLSTELAGLFSSDIFQDDKYPFRLIVKLANLPEDKITKLKNEIKYAYLGSKLPKRYNKYSRDLWRFTQNDYYLREFIASVSKLRDITGESSASDGQNLNSA